MFYNTTSETGSTLKGFRNASLGQDNEVLFFFRSHSDKSYSSHDVEDHFKKYPRSSIVRSMNTLEREGKISKTGLKVEGKYGRPVHTYRFSDETGQNNLF